MKLHKKNAPTKPTTTTTAHLNKTKLKAESQIQRIRKRDWRDIRSAWLNFPPIWDGKTGAEMELNEFIALEDVHSSLNEQHELRKSITGLHSLVVEDALMSLFKAANIIGCCERQNSGHPTWSLAIAYQGALFALEAALKLFGICVVEIKNMTIIMDMWAAPSEGLSKTQLGRFKLGEEILFLKSENFNHYDKWALLKRVLNIIEHEPIPDDLFKTLVNIDERRFAKQRNHLHYRSVWYFDDLTILLEKPEIATFNDMRSLLDSLDPDTDNFSIALAFAAMSVCLFLLKDLASISPSFDKYFQLLETTLNSNQHPFFSDMFSQVLMPEYLSKTNKLLAQLNHA
jgi:hypothetical protein